MPFHSTQTSGPLSMERSFEYFFLQSAGWTIVVEQKSSSRVRENPPYASTHPIPIEPRTLGNIYYDHNNSNSNNSILYDIGGAQAAGVPRFTTTSRPEGKNPKRCHFPRVKVLLYNPARPARVISSFHIYILCVRKSVDLREWKQLVGGGLFSRLYEEIRWK